MNNVRTGVRSVWKRSWTFLGVILQRFGSERDNQIWEPLDFLSMRDNILGTKQVSLPAPPHPHVYGSLAKSFANNSVSGLLHKATVATDVVKYNLAWVEPNSTIIKLEFLITAHCGT